MLRELGWLRCVRDEWGTGLARKRWNREDPDSFTEAFVLCQCQRKAKDP